MRIINNIVDFIKEQETNKIWYHGSDHKFDTFENFKSNGPSALGIFVTDDLVLAEIFGDNIYKVNITYSNPYTITMDKWDSIRETNAKDTQYFINMRNDLINKGFDSIFIKERIWRSSGGVEFKDGNIIVLFDKSQLSIKK